jgi:hypothetical protein
LQTKLLLIITVTGCFLCGNIFAALPANLDNATVSNVTGVNGACVKSTTNGGGIQFWDIQAGGTYDVTLSGVTDCASQGQETTIGVVVHNSAGGNIYAVANIQDVGVYTFTITLTTQCLTMPIEYCTHDSIGLPANQPGSGMFAQDFVANAPGGHEGHLRTATFDDSRNVTGVDTTCQGTPQTASITVCKYYDKNANGNQDMGEPSLSGWPFCIDPLDNGSPALHTQLTAAGGCVQLEQLDDSGRLYSYGGKRE